MLKELVAYFQQGDNPGAWTCVVSNGTVVLTAPMRREGSALAFSVGPVGARGPEPGDLDYVDVNFDEATGGASKLGVCTWLCAAFKLSTSICNGASTTLFGSVWLGRKSPISDCVTCS